LKQNIITVESQLLELQLSGHQNVISSTCKVYKMAMTTRPFINIL